MSKQICVHSLAHFPYCAQKDTACEIRNNQYCMRCPTLTIFFSFCQPPKTYDDMTASSPLSSSSYPFDAVVITFPDQRSADSASLQLDDLVAACFANVPTTPATAVPRILATTDPWGARVGSGGGSLAALQHWSSVVNDDGEGGRGGGTSRHNADTTVPSNNADESILILHAGGESSRCPTQMVLGKAWTSLPTLGGGSGGADLDTRPGLTTPIQVWIQTCGKLFQGLPRGSIVIVASDTLLRLPPLHYAAVGGGGGGDYDNKKYGEIVWDWNWMETLSQSQQPDGGSQAVLGLAVPAPLETAKNHGVYILDENALEMPSSSSFKQHPAMFLAPCQQVLQKPSFETLEKLCHHDPKHAWIDTGVVVFLPASAGALKQLATTHLAACTRHGLVRMMSEEEQPPESPTEESLTRFAMTHALKVDLYTHFLQALKVTGPSSSPDDSTRTESIRQIRYIQQQTDLPTEVARGIFESLGNFSLQILAVPTGAFLHLGTTRELMDFYIHGSAGHHHHLGPASQHHAETDNLTAPPTRHQILCQQFGRDIRLVSRLQTIYQSQRSSAIHSSAVLFHSVLRMTCEPSQVSLENGLSVGPGSVIEHCYFVSDESIQIGSGCLVSGLRSVHYRHGHKHRDEPKDLHDRNPDKFWLPSGLVVQQVQLRQLETITTTAMSEPSSVYILFGVDDSIKDAQHLTFLGRPIHSFLDWIDLKEENLWDKGKQQSLWMAKLHPIVTSESFDACFSWLSDFLTQKDASIPTLDAMKLWKSLPKLSLSEIRDRADASAELEFRKHLIDYMIPAERRRHLDNVRSTLMQRSHQSIDFQFLVDSYVVGSATRTEIAGLNNCLSEVFRKALAEEEFDVCGRACTVQAAFHDQLAQHSPAAIGANAGVLAEKMPTLTDLAAIAKVLNENDPDLLSAYEKLSHLVSDALVLADGSGKVLMQASRILDSVASAMTKRCVRAAQKQVALDRPRRAAVVNQWVIATAPARIDLAGGWTDTPPICFEYGAAVTGFAVSVDGLKPLSCRCRILPGAGGILVRAESRNCNSGDLESATECRLQSWDDLSDYCDPSADCALLKSALVCLGMANPLTCEATKEDFQPHIKKFCQQDTLCCLEIVSTSLLPHGSGLGTSSILGGCALAAIAVCCGIDLRLDDDMHELIDAVLLLEQLLTTGGGFQDQVNGLMAGAKIVTCLPSKVPLQLFIEHIELSKSIKERLDENLVLIFTGKTRLAKGILQSVLRRWAMRSLDIMQCVAGLVDGAKRSQRALAEGDLDSLGMCLSEYWELKKVMAGQGSGAEPPYIHDLLSLLLSKGLIRGASLCGAGGGGFMAVLMQDGYGSDELKEILASNELTTLLEQDQLFVAHDCKICEQGLSATVVSSSFEADAFELAWHQL